jgi:hypothetical protein
MTAATLQIGEWLEQFFASQPVTPFRELKEAAFRRFSEAGFPTTHDE